MKKVLIALCIIGISSAFVINNNQQGNTPKDGALRTIKNNKFSRTEKFVYLAHYGFINAGKAEVIMDKDIHIKNNRPCYKVDVKGYSVGLFAVAMHLQDSWRSYIDTSAIIPHEFFRHIEENNYRLEETSVFNHKSKKVIVDQVKNGNKSKKEYDIPSFTQDLVSGYYYLRTLDFANRKAGDTLVVDAFFENKYYDFKIKYLGKDVIKTEFGKINAFVMSPIMPENELFEGGSSIQFWVSDDANRVPLKVKAKLYVGSVELDLIEAQGLLTEFNTYKKK